MAKKKEVAKEGAEKEVEVVDTDGVVFVNRDKLDRAKEIVALVSGALVPKTEEQMERKDRFTAKFAEAEIAPKGKEALRFAYETLGGLVRTRAEQAAVGEQVAQMKKKQKKKQVEE